MAIKVSEDPDLLSKLQSCFHIPGFTFHLGMNVPVVNFSKEYPASLGNIENGCVNYLAHGSVLKELYSEGHLSMRCQTKVQIHKYFYNPFLLCHLQVVFIIIVIIIVIIITSA